MYRRIKLYFKTVYSNVSKSGSQPLLWLEMARSRKTASKNCIFSDLSCTITAELWGQLHRCGAMNSPLTTVNIKTTLLSTSACNYFFMSPNKSSFTWFSGSHPPVLPRGGYMRSPSWTRCSKVEPPRERKHHSDSDTAEPLMKLERPKQPWCLRWNSQTAERETPVPDRRSQSGNTKRTRRPPSAIVHSHNVSWCWIDEFRLNFGHCALYFN